MTTEIPSKPDPNKPETSTLNEQNSGCLSHEKAKMNPPPRFGNLVATGLRHSHGRKKKTVREEKHLLPLKAPPHEA
jgi:hypothetical protein